MAKNQFVIGMDGGATKTAAMLGDLSGKVLAEESGGPSNPQVVGTDTTAAVILQLLEKLCGAVRCDTSEVLSIVAGLAGAGRDADKERVKSAILAEANKKKITIGRVGELVGKMRVWTFLISPWMSPMARACLWLSQRKISPPGLRQREASGISSSTWPTARAVAAS